MSNHSIKPVGNRLLIKRSKAAEAKGGILLPSSAQDKPREGEVVAVGPGKYDEQGQLQPLSISVGDHVLFGPYAGTQVADEELLIMAEDDVLGILIKQ